VLSGEHREIKVVVRVTFAKGRSGGVMWLAGSGWGRYVLTGQCGSIFDMTYEQRYGRLQIASMMILIAKTTCYTMR